MPWPAWLPFGLHGGLRGFAEWLFWVPSFYYHLWTHFSAVVVPVRRVAYGSSVMRCVLMQHACR